MGNKIYTLRFRAVNRDVFDAIKSGKKNVETRAATVKYRNIQPGDNVVLVCGRNKFERRAKKVTIFKTVALLLKKYKFKEINPYVGSEKELRRMYYSFPGYKEKIKKNGLVALELD